MANSSVTTIARYNSSRKNSTKPIRLAHGGVVSTITLPIESSANESTTTSSGPRRTTIIITRTQSTSSVTTITPIIVPATTSSPPVQAPPSISNAETTSQVPVPVAPVPVPSSSPANSPSTAAPVPVLSLSVTFSTMITSFSPIPSSQPSSSLSDFSSSSSSFSTSIRSTSLTSSTSLRVPVSSASAAPNEDVVQPTKKLAPPVIGGIVAVVIAAVVFMALLAWFWRKHRARRHVRELNWMGSTFSLYDQGAYRDMDSSNATVLQRMRSGVKRGFSSVRRGFVMRAGVVSAGVKSRVGTFRRKTTNMSFGVRNNPQMQRRFSPSLDTTPVASVNMDRGTSQFFDAPVLLSPQNQQNSPANPFRDPQPTMPFNPSANNSTGTLQPGLFRGLMLHLHVPAGTGPSAESSSESSSEGQPRHLPAGHIRERSETGTTSVPSLSAWWPPDETVEHDSASNYSHSFNNSSYTNVSHGEGLVRSFEPPAPLHIRRNQAEDKREDQLSWYEREERERLRWTRLDFERARRGQDGM